MEIRYVAKGLLLAKTVSNPITSKVLASDSRQGILDSIETEFKRNEKYFYGGVFGISEETAVEFEGDEYIKTKRLLHFVGDLTQEQMDYLTTCYFDELHKAKQIF